MLNMTERSKAFLQKNIPEVLNMEKKRDALTAIYDFIDDNGFAPPNFLYYNKLGKEAQDVYDDLYANN